MPAAVSPLLSALASPSLAEALFDLVPDAVFFAKDRTGRYIAVNRTLVERCGRHDKSEVLGKTVSELFPPELARRYAAQDQLVLTTGRRVADKLELHLYTDRRPGWCLTNKIPVRDATGAIIGLAGLSRDLAAPDEARTIPESLAVTIEWLQKHFDQPITTGDLAAKAKLSSVRFSRLVKRIFHLTPGQLLSQTRLQEATRLLRETEQSVAAIAAACGFYDHSAFTRQFKAATGVAPLAYRRSAHSNGA